MPPFLLLGESYGDARMGVARIFGVCFTFLFASSVVASTIDVGPSDWRNYGPNGSHTGQGVKSTFGQNVRLPPTISGPTRVLPVSRNPVIPYGSVANGLKNFTRINPASVAASAAITALFLGLDWAFDEELDSWAYEGEPSIQEGDLIWRSSRSDEWQYGSYPTADQACQGIGEAIQSPFPYSHADIYSSTGARCRFMNGSTEFTYFSVNRFASCTAPAVYNPSLGGCVIEGEWEAVDDQQFLELQSSLPSSDPQLVSDAAHDAMKRQGAPLSGYTDLEMTGPTSVSGPDTTSTSTDPVTGDTIVTNTSTQTDISYGPTTITTTNTTTSTTYQNGQETDTTVTTETPGELPVTGGGGGAGDWPGFCDWATVVCDWLDWTREEPPPEQDLPALVDDDFYTERDISFGSKSCPEPYQVNLAPFMDTQVSVSFQPLCDFAGLIYYMVMAASYIIAAYISIGVARA